MQVVVKKPHTRQNLFEVKGRIPRKLVRYLQSEFGKDYSIIQNDDELIDPFTSDWYKKTKANITPEKALRHYRENRGLTQPALAKHLSEISNRTLSRQNISDMENGRRPISKELAKKLALFFETSPDRFI